MADSNTTTYSFTLPEVGASADSWGTKLNANWDKVDDLLDGSIAVNGITVTGGSIDGTPVGATTPSTGEFTTLSADGLTVDGTATTGINGSNYTYSGTNYEVHALVGTSGGGVRLGQDSVTRDSFIGTTGANHLDIVTYNGSAWGKRAKFHNNGDVSFFEDTGTTAKMVWDASAEGLGIGTSSPLQALHVNSGTGNSSAIFESTDSTSQIWLKDSASSSTYQTGIGCFGDNLLFNNGGERARIDSSGNLLVGKTSTNFNTDGFQAFNGGFVHATATQGTANSGTVVTVNRKSTDGSIVDLKKNGSTVGSIGTYDGRPYLASTTVGIRVSNALFPSNTSGVITDGTMNVGGTAGRFKDLYLSGGVYLGGTGSANKLDSYEEGTWTPALSGYSGVTHSLQSGVYTKVGRLVTLHFQLSISDVGTYVSNSRIVGLPFYATGYYDTPGVGSQPTIMTAVNTTRDEHYMAVYNGGNSVFVYSKTGSALNGNNYQAGTISGTISYLTNS